VQELGGSTARQIAKLDSGKDFILSLFCMFIFVIIIISSSSSSSSSSISFVVLLNFVSTHDLSLLSISPPHPAGGEGEG